MQSFNVKVNIASHKKILVESGIDNTSSNISIIPITILYTNKINLKTNHNTGIHYNIGTNTSIVHNTSIPVLRSPSTGDPKLINITLVMLMKNVARGQCVCDDNFCYKIIIS